MLRQLFFTALFTTMPLSVTFAQSNASMDKGTILVKLDQTPGQFLQSSLELPAGAYVFEIENHEVGKDVGFYLHAEGEKAPVKGSNKAGLVSNNSSSKTQTVMLEPGVYKYSCPLNPTPEYTLVVKEKN